MHWDKPNDGPNFEAVFNPFWLFFAFVVSGILRSTLGRLIGSIATGGVLAVLAWFLVGSLAVALIAAVLGFLLSMFLDLLPSGGEQRLVGRQRSSSRQRLEQRLQFQRQRRFQRRRWQLWRRRRIGELVAWASGASAGICSHHRWRERRIFTPKVLARIEQAIKAGEATHSGQVRFVVEGALDGAPLFRNQPARERALDIFSRLRIWDTAITTAC